MRPAPVPFLVLLSFLALASGPALSQHASAGDTPSQTARRRVVSADLLGEIRLAPGGTVLGTPLGGLSGITYDREREVYYAVSDDRSGRAPARFYRLTISLSGGRLEAGGVDFTGVITLTDPAGQAFAPNSLDPEGIALSPSGALFVSSEGDSNAAPPIAPFVNAFGLDGRQSSALPVPPYYLPSGAGGAGVRNNLAFEPLAVSPAGAILYTATENALVQDGPAPTRAAGSPARVLAWDLATGRVAFEHVYPVSPIPAAPNPAGGGADNGLAELVALDDRGTLLAMERSYAAGVGNTVRLFETTVEGATDVSGRSSLIDPATGNPLALTPMAKRRLADIGELGVRPDNLEGMTLGPALPDGRRVLILVSDDNFNPQQVTQFVALGLRIEEVADRAVVFLPRALNGR